MRRNAPGQRNYKFDGVAGELRGVAVLEGSCLFLAPNAHVHATLSSLTTTTPILTS